jgi:tetratricopeptide (TPR) repeat protein
MMNRSLMQRLARWLAVAVLLGAGLGAGLGAMAQAEPTLKQIYDAAQAGRLEQAQTMIQQVLVLHPKSAKAHFVQAELAARQGQIARAREALAEAEKLAPGLPFAKPEAVQSLRAALCWPKPATAAKPGAQCGAAAAPGGAVRGVHGARAGLVLADGAGPGAGRRGDRSGDLSGAAQAGSGSRATGGIWQPRHGGQRFERSADLWHRRLRRASLWPGPVWAGAGQRPGRQGHGRAGHRPGGGRRRGRRPRWRAATTAAATGIPERQHRRPLPLTIAP